MPPSLPAPLTLNDCVGSGVGTGVGVNLTADGVGEGSSTVGLGVDSGRAGVGTGVDGLAGVATGAAVLGDEAVSPDGVAPQAVKTAEASTKTPTNTRDRTSRRVNGDVAPPGRHPPSTWLGAAPHRARQSATPRLLPP